MTGQKERASGGGILSDPRFQREIKRCEGLDPEIFLRKVKRAAFFFLCTYPPHFKRQVEHRLFSIL